ncbi:MAG TPA: hypothetical protein VFP69_16100 [Streptomyces sp.]|jgi:hypothetical protein|nr:hypothetical protein [Streptomyces sp.]
MGERLQIRFEGDGPDHERELRSLLNWLSDDRSLRGHVRLERIDADGAGRMGPEIEAVLAVVSTAAGVMQLPLAYLAWRQARRSRPPALTIHIDGADPDEVEDLLRRLRGGERDGDSGEAGA